MTDYNVMPDYQTRRKIINDICEKYSFVIIHSQAKAYAADVLMFCTSATQKTACFTAQAFTVPNILPLRRFSNFLNNAPMQWKTIPL